MTGRDIMMYILTHQLEDKQVFQNGRFLDCLSEAEAAVKFGVGEATVRVWFEMGVLDGFRIGDQVFISPTAAPPGGTLHHITDEVVKDFIKRYERKD